MCNQFTIQRCGQYDYATQQFVNTFVPQQRGPRLYFSITDEPANYYDQGGDSYVIINSGNRGRNIGTQQYAPQQYAPQYYQPQVSQNMMYQMFMNFLMYLSQMMGRNNNYQVNNNQVNNGNCNCSCHQPAQPVQTQQPAATQPAAPAATQSTTPAAQAQQPVTITRHPNGNIATRTVRTLDPETGKERVVVTEFNDEGRRTKMTSTIGGDTKNDTVVEYYPDGQTPRYREYTLRNGSERTRVNVHLDKKGRPTSGNIRTYSNGVKTTHDEFSYKYDRKGRRLLTHRVLERYDSTTGDLRHRYVAQHGWGSGNRWGRNKCDYDVYHGDGRKSNRGSDPVLDHPEVPGL